MRNKISFIFLLAVALVAGSFGLVGAQPKISQVCFRDRCFNVEIADNPEARSKGLMWRSGLEEGQGMFFYFETSGIYNFWMKNVSFPIDIIWLDAEKKIVHVKKKVPPCRKDPCPTYNPRVKAQYVLEIQSGAFDRNKLKMGDKAELK